MTTTVTRFSYRGLRIVMHGLNRPEERILNTMVIGAGEAGSMIIHELKFSKHLNRKVVCVIDDNPSKKENIYTVFRLWAIKIRSLRKPRNITWTKLYWQFLQQGQKSQETF